jgi:hypothetical protein
VEDKIEFVTLGEHFARSSTLEDPYFKKGVPAD